MPRIGVPIDFSDNAAESLEIRARKALLRRAKPARGDTSRISMDDVRAEQLPSEVETNLQALLNSLGDTIPPGKSGKVSTASTTSRFAKSSTICSDGRSRVRPLPTGCRKVRERPGRTTTRRCIRRRRLRPWKKWCRRPGRLSWNHIRKRRNLRREGAVDGHSAISCPTGRPSRTIHPQGRPDQIQAGRASAPPAAAMATGARRPRRSSTNRLQSTPSTRCSRTAGAERRGCSQGVVAPRAHLQLSGLNRRSFTASPRSDRSAVACLWARAVRDDGTELSDDAGL